MKKAEIPYPPHVELACLPTPIQPLKRLGKQLGVELYVKRDDLTEVACSGNKIRKLEFSMARRPGQGGRHGDHLRRRPVQPLPGDRHRRRSSRAPL